MQANTDQQHHASYVNEALGQVWKQEPWFSQPVVITRAPSERSHGTFVLVSELRLSTLLHRLLARERRIPLLAGRQHL